MAAAHQRWDTTHNPNANPLGCNGKPGKSGYDKHKRAGTEICSRCRKAHNHWQREHRRKAHNGRRLKPCGTYAAYARHKRHGEPVDLACSVAASEYAHERREMRKKLKETNAQETQGDQCPR